MIIFISGSINSGKSTVAKIVADRLGKTALIEIDSLRDFIGWMSLDEAVPISLENASSIIKIFSMRNINAVVPYPLSKKNYEYFLETLKEWVGVIHVFVLSPRLDVILNNRGLRELNDWEKERIKYHYSIGISNPDFGITLDNTGHTPEETAEIIIKTLEIGPGNN